ncbi:Methyltransferase type 12 [Sulfitobacter noctilucicola]|uniref:2-polyprenyl-3-methyl-5-hydroxy-6-metoxy-1, 4-benzoquinol methylase n=1 Tax=Sulfitobacter noctilucicola TaxID=1342301 RepID=A0A7W6Q2U3_9RHOB|nr:class I SAM-dependent methyltransferase [Sulfitobacter noctilucicola]KIN62061.1 Methyltransferase type 12 [Sulfitobacter noctilucicola]MBB4173420.1 2-polyprenyl-3-methyl-5-hydroxy-6-metoxy-1,4-benzoquinol methylase [Sulfitobacter noctilucicola]
MTGDTTDGTPAWIKAVSADQLDAFVDWVDQTGGLEQPGFDAIQQTFVYQPATQVDQDLDPFSDAYFDQMLSLYAELSGRILNQETGELTRFDMADHVPHTNPYASDNVSMMARHVNAITAAICRADLPAGARVADLGCGWGMTSEILSFCGSDVTAVDINADFVALVRARAARLSNGIDVVQSNFDELSLPQNYDAVFFYECMHHAVKPWETLEQVAGFLKPDGKVFFAGEPINTLWWRNWGLRLDASAVYCIRKHGWFESGWSPEFLHQMFERMGWSLTLHPHVGLNGGDIGVARRGVVKRVPQEPPVVEQDSSEADHLRAALAQAEQQRDHARRYPWKYLRGAWEQRSIGGKR